MPYSQQQINSLYQTNLGRNVGQAGADFYMGSDKPWEQIQAEIAASPEAMQYAQSGQQQFVPANQQVGGIGYNTNLPALTPTTSISSVQPQGAMTSADLNQIYQSSLGRSVGQAGADFYLSSGKTPEQIQAEIAASPEAMQYAQTNQQRYVDPSQQFGDLPYSYNVDPRTDPTAATTRGQTGLLGLENEYQRGLYASEQGLESFEGTLDPWAEGGQAAFQQQQALSGVLGPEAQQQAYDDFISSPGQDWLKEQSMREAENYAAATGQTLSGNILAELERRAMGLAQQDYGNFYSRMSDIASTGGQAASKLASGQLGSGQFDATMMQNLGRARYGAGADIATIIGSTVGSVADLQQQQGVTDANVYGTGVANIANAIGLTGQQMAQMPMDVAVLLANLAVQSGTERANYISSGGVYEAAGLSAAGKSYMQGISGALDSWAAGGADSGTDWAGYGTDLADFDWTSGEPG